MKTYSCCQTFEISNSPLYWTARLSVRLLWGSAQAMHLLISHRHKISETDFWSAVRPHRYSEVPRVDYKKLSDDRLGEPSANVQTRVEAAREIQRQRFKQGSPMEFESASDLTCNSDMRPAEVRKFCQLDDTSQSLMRSAMNQMQLSARAYHRALKLARTIADLAGELNITPQHLAEALQYRPKLTLF